MKNLFNFSILILLLVQSSCKIVYFDQPQPIDGKVIASFPKKFRGTWKSELNTLSIGKNSTTFITFDNVRVPVHTADTSSIFIIKEDVIYKFDGNEHLEYKANFTLSNDTLDVLKPTEIKEQVLGQRIVLNKAGKYYILNFLEDNGMWQVILLKQTDEKEIQFILLNNDKLLEVIQKERLEEIRPSSPSENSDSKDYYYAGKLNKDDMINLIENGAFTDTLFHLSNDSKWEYSFLNSK